jgi:hypothetical protein
MARKRKADITEVEVQVAEIPATSPAAEVSLNGLVEVVATEKSTYMKAGKSYVVTAKTAENLIKIGKAKLK